jgi:hypothetical protein
MVLSRRLLVFLLGAVLGLALPGSAAQQRWSPAEQREFLARHWRLPIPPQGKPPTRFSPLEASLQPESCGACHPAQFADWQTSLHAKAMGPGVIGQLEEMVENDPASALHCYTCHAPLTEQQEKVDDGKGGYTVNRIFDAKLQTSGLGCAACHVREHQRFGPPKRDGSLASDLPRERLPHNGVTRTPAVLQAEFCKACHQFPPDGYALNGKLLENTYNEWKASPSGRAGVQCQECHMPDRRHLWRGIHDPEMVRSGVMVALTTDKPRYRPGEAVNATLTITNEKVGHYFPTYVTPRVVARAELRDAQGRPIQGSREERIIGRQVTPDLSRELADTRIAPGKSFVLRYRRPLKQPGLRLKVTVTVYPDHFYTGFFESLLAQGAGKGAAQIREALASTRRSPFVLFEKELALN